MEENNSLPNMMFTVGNSLFMTSVENVRYIGSIPENITVIPHSPNFVRGFCDYSGDSITMVDLCTVLFGNEPDNERYFFAVDKYGFIVSEVLGIEPPGEFERANAGPGSIHIKKAYTMSNGVYERYRDYTNSNAVFVPDFDKIYGQIKIPRT